MRTVSAGGIASAREGKLASFAAGVEADKHAIAAAIVGAVILDQIPTPVEAAGIALIVIASLLRSHEDV